MHRRRAGSTYALDIETKFMRNAGAATLTVAGYADVSWRWLTGQRRKYLWRTLTSSPTLSITG